jgi:hypothetical protein
MVNDTPRTLNSRKRDPVAIVQKAGWAATPVRTGAENLAHTGIRSLDRPARGESLYRLRYPSRSHFIVNTYITLLLQLP